MTTSTRITRLATGVATLAIAGSAVPVALAVGEPFDVPPGDDETTIERARAELETRLRALEVRARELLGSGLQAPGSGLGKA